MAIKSHVRAVRERLGMRQQDLAAHVRVSRQTVIALERDGYTPSTELALRLAIALDATVEDLFALEGE